MDDMRFRAMSRQRDSKLWDESRFEDPNHGDDLPKACPQCNRDEHSWQLDDGDLICACGELIE